VKKWAEVENVSPEPDFEKMNKVVREKFSKTWALLSCKKIDG
jgi:hypothetical protein